MIGAYKITFFFLLFFSFLRFLCFLFVYLFIYFLNLMSLVIIQLMLQKLFLKNCCGSGYVKIHLSHLPPDLKKKKSGFIFKNSPPHLLSASTCVNKPKQRQRLHNHMTSPLRSGWRRRRGVRLFGAVSVSWCARRAKWCSRIKAARCGLAQSGTHHFNPAALPSGLAHTLRAA